jgi:Ca2+-binding RTX toxin-like protein
MANKKFNITELKYIGTAVADNITGNNVDNFIYGLGGNDFILGLAGDDLINAGNGNNIIDGGTGSDTIIAGTGNDKINGGKGFDTIYSGNGKNHVDGGIGDDNINAGLGKDVLLGGAGNDAINGGGGDDSITGGAGNDSLQGGGSTAGNQTIRGDYYAIGSGLDEYFGGTGNDTFVINGNINGFSLIDGGTSSNDNKGIAARYIGYVVDEDTGVATAYDTQTNTVVLIDWLALAEQTETDVRLNLVTRPGSGNLSTQASTISGYNAVDTLEFKKSGNFVNTLEFINIERIELADGVNIRLSGDVLTENGESQDRGYLNPGLQFFGVAGGLEEKVVVEVQYDDISYTQTSIVLGSKPEVLLDDGVPVLDEEGKPVYILDDLGRQIMVPINYQKQYAGGDFQLDDYTVGNLFHNIQAIYDARTNSTAGSYVRIDGANETGGAGEIVYGSEGVDNATMRLGNDTYYGNGGNDLLIGHGGADLLDGGAGDDIFVIGGFGSGIQGTTSKADDGAPEWIATGAKHDLIVGGLGNDTLRITTGIGADTQAHGTVLLNDANLKGVEVVQVGGTVGRLNTEDSALQLINDHYYFKASGSVSDTSAALGNNGGSIDNVVIDASGVTENGLLFEGNANTQTFIGTSKADTFIGNGGNDVLTGGEGVDTFVYGKVYEQKVTGLTSTVQTYVNTASHLTGVDTITDFKLGIDKLQFNIDQFSNLSGFSATNLVVGASAVDNNDYLVFDSTTHTLSYDADANGAGISVDIVTLVGVTTLSVTDIVFG